MAELVGPLTLWLQNEVACPLQCTQDFHSRYKCCASHLHEVDNREASLLARLAAHLQVQPRHISRQLACMARWSRVRTVKRWLGLSRISPSCGKKL